MAVMPLADQLSLHESGKIQCRPEFSRNSLGQWLHVDFVRLPPEDLAAFGDHSLRVGAAHNPLCAGFGTAAVKHIEEESVNVLGRYLEFAEHNVWA